MDVLDSRSSHSFAFVSHLTGMQIVVKASYQSRILQRRVSPALPDLFVPIATRISAAMDRDFQGSDGWKEMSPLSAAVSSLSEGMALVLFGTDMAKDQKLVQLAYKLTEDSRFP